MKTALDYVLEERIRQTVKKGYTSEHDDQHKNGRLAVAAACYAVNKMPDVTISVCRASHTECGMQLQDAWPWDREWDKRQKHSRFRSAVISCSLMLAELERMIRNGEND